MRASTLLAGLAWLAVLSAPLARAEAVERFAVATSAGPRAYVVAASAGPGPFPLVLVLHGGGGTAERALVSDRIDATDLIWAFFGRHRRP